MQIDLLTTAITCGVLGFGCWIMAARNKRRDRLDEQAHSKPGVYLRSSLFTTRGNLWRWGYLVLNAIAVASFGGVLILSLT